MSKISIFTDGASRGNPGKGGWASVVVAGHELPEGEDMPIKLLEGRVVEVGGADKHTTNNRMELMAAIGGLEALVPLHVGVKTKETKPLKSSKKVKDTGASKSKSLSVTIFTDSSYVINGITKWVHGWKKNGWKTKTKDDVLNKDLWLELYRLALKFKIEWKYVGGHVGIVGNERCDHIATSFADGNKVDLYNGLLANYDLPNILDISIDESKQELKKSDSSRSRAKAYSYVSRVGGVIEVHHSWLECEKRVKGAKGAKYKKSLDFNDQAKIVEEFGTF